MRDDVDWERLIEGLRSGDEDVVGDFRRRYGEPLERVAERYIAPGLRRRFGAESVVQSACCSFLRRARAGEFRVGDGEELWRLLCAITLRKVRQQARFHTREKRAVSRETGEAREDGHAAAGPRPDEALAIADAFEHVLASLDEELRRIVELKLQERSNGEVAEALGCSERTVRRLLAGLRERLELALGT